MAFQIILLNIQKNHFFGKGLFDNYEYKDEATNNFFVFDKARRRDVHFAKHWKSEDSQIDLRIHNEVIF